MVTRVFSAEALDERLADGAWVDGQSVPYTASELEEIYGTVDTMFEQITSGITPVIDATPEYHIAVGSPGSGKTTYLQNFIRSSGAKQFVILDADFIRENFMLFKEAVSSRQGGVSF